MEEGPREVFVVGGGGDGFTWVMRLIDLPVFVREGDKLKCRYRYRWKTASLKVYLAWDLGHR